MRRLLLIAVAFVASVGSAEARTTREFLDRCADDEAWCAKEIKIAREAIEKGVMARKKLCMPQGLSDEGLVGEVTYWITEQVPSMDQRPDAESIGAALVALYGCDTAKGLEGL
jgi:hypothetical protein